MIASYVYFELLDPRADLPFRGTPNSVGLDLSTLEDVTINPGDRVRLRTGIRYASPPRMEQAGMLLEAQVRLRSSTYDRYGVIMPNAPGTIDPDYTGEILIQVVNFWDCPTTIPAKTRLAQLVFNLVPFVEPMVKAYTPREQRDGFGSTGN